MKYSRHKVIQGSIGWHWLRAGRVGSSTLKNLMGTESAQKGMVARIKEELAAKGERPGKAEWDVPAPENLDTRATAWGRRNEPRAAAGIELALGQDIDRGPVLSPHITQIFMLSLDGMTEAGEPVEIKCPYNREVHLGTLANGMPTGHRAQIQAGMIATGADRGLFCSFDPRQDAPNDLYLEWIDRDQKYCDEVIRRLMRLAHCIKTGEDYQPFPAYGSFNYNPKTDDVPQLFG